MDTEIPLIALRGTHYEMGRQHGLQVVHLRPLIVKAIEARFAQIESDGPDERFESLVRETAEVLRELDPPILEMIRGQAEALGLEFDTLLRYDLVSYLRDNLIIRRSMAGSRSESRGVRGVSPCPHFSSVKAQSSGLCPEASSRGSARGAQLEESIPYSMEKKGNYCGGTPPTPPDSLRKPMASEGCTTWAAVGSVTADGEPLLVKNRDYRPEHLPLQVFVTATPAVGYRYVFGSSAGSPGVFSAGMNERGLAIADTHVYSADIGPGLPDYSLMMHILEEHDTLRSALDYLSSVPRMGRNNLILADAAGNVAVVELGYHHLAIVEAQNGIAVNTNHFVSPSLKDSFVDCALPSVKGNSFHRYDLVRRELEAARGSIDVAFAQRLMATHAGPLASICRHLELDGQSATIATTIYQPARRTLRFCHGYPCESPYQVITFDNGQGSLNDVACHHEEQFVWPGLQIQAER